MGRLGIGLGARFGLGVARQIVPFRLGRALVSDVECRRLLGRAAGAGRDEVRPRPIELRVGGAGLPRPVVSAGRRRGGGAKLDERRRRNLSGEVFAVASSRASAHLRAAVAEDPRLRAVLARVEERELDPLSAVRQILEEVFDVRADHR